MTISIEDYENVKRKLAESDTAIQTVKEVQDSLDRILRLTSDPGKIADSFNDSQTTLALRLKPAGWRLERRH